MNLSKLLHKIKKASLQFHITPSPEVGASLDSYIGGTPYHPAGTPYPTCSTCQSSLVFLFQLRIPEGDGVAINSWYYCFHCTPTEGGNEGFAYLHYPNPDLDQQDVLVQSSPFKKGAIILEPSWHTPSWPTFVQYFSEVSETLNTTFSKETIRFYEHERLLIHPQEEESFSYWGGYPTYLEKVHHPSCSCCRLPMSFVLQMHSDKRLDFVFPSFGTLYIYQCASTGEVRFVID